MCCASISGTGPLIGTSPRQQSTMLSGLIVLRCARLTHFSWSMSDLHTCLLVTSRYMCTINRDRYPFNYFVIKYWTLSPLSPNGNKLKGEKKRGGGKIIFPQKKKKKISPIIKYLIKVKCPLGTRTSFW